jgi:hypothetical protein
MMDAIHSFVLYDFATIAAAAGRVIRPVPANNPGPMLPPLSIWVDVESPDGEHLGLGIVIAYDEDDPEYVIVQLNGERKTVHWTEVGWARLSGEAS